MKKEYDNKLKTLCTILLSIFLVISGGFIVGKLVFLRAEDNVTKSDSVTNEREEDIEIVCSEEQNQLTKVDLSKKISDEKLLVEPSSDIKPLDKMNREISYVEARFVDQTGNSKLISPKKYDLRVIPDKYNTGCKGELIKATRGRYTISGLDIGESGGNIVFDFFYRNKDASGTYIIENYDFSDFGVAFNSENKVSGKKINIIFNNCKFSTINTTMRPASDVFVHTYNNCTIERFSGSNSVFNNCKFGDSFSDCIVPFSNVYVQNSYFANLASNDPKGNGKHSDGTQMYGYSDSMVQNVYFSNCRFEIPAVKTTNSTSAVNACIMLGLEYNNGHNIRIEDCILNGGGYSIYAGKKYPELKMSQVVFSNIKIGSAKLYGNIYPSVDENVVFENVDDQDSLYVSSVWNDGKKTHVIVSNDTAEERIIRIVTGTKSKDFTIGACPGGKTLRYDLVDVPFEEFPFDIDVSIDSDADYVICFDITDGFENQIRYVSFDGEPTYYNSNKASNCSQDEVEDSDNGNVLIEGLCGNNITYQLDIEGRLILNGTGNMDNYHSQKTAPWYDYSDRIFSIEISEGITNIGSQAFRKLKNVKNVVFPKSLTKINANAFSGCSGLKEITLYQGVTSIDKYAFGGVKLNKCTYHGTQAMWDNISIGLNNDTLLSCEKNFLTK